MPEFQEKHQEHQQKHQKYLPFARQAITIEISQL